MDSKRGNELSLDQVQSRIGGINSRQENLYCKYIAQGIVLHTPFS